MKHSGSLKGKSTGQRERHQQGHIRNRNERDHKQHTAQIAPGNRLIPGRNAVRQLLRFSPERAVKCYVQTSRNGGSDRTGEDLLSEIKALKISVIELERDALSRLCESDSHQGFVLEVKERVFWDLKQLTSIFKEREKAIILALDDIQDPQNLGSILRAAECLGVDAVVWSKNRGVDVTPAVVKVSVGASEIVPIAKVSNLREALSKLKDAGFWVVATMLSPDATKLSAFKFPEKSVIVMGGEGDGVQPLIAKEADFRLYIQQYGVIDSLNVSQATAVVLSEYGRQHLDVDKLC